MQRGDIRYETGHCECTSLTLIPYCFHRYAKVLKVYPPIHGNPEAALVENKDGNNVKRIKTADLFTRPATSWGR